MKKIAYGFLGLACVSSVAHAELSRSQITNRKELNSLNTYLATMQKDEAGEATKTIETGLSAENNSGGGNIWSIPFSFSISRNDKVSFNFETSYDKEVNNGVVGKQGLSDANFYLSNTDAFNSSLGKISYNLGMTAPMNEVSTGSATQYASAGIKRAIASDWDIRFLAKATHYNVSPDNVDSWSKKVTLKLVSTNGLSAAVSRKTQAGNAGLGKFDLGYKTKTGWMPNGTLELGYSKMLTDDKGYTLSASLTRSFDFR